MRSGRRRRIGWLRCPVPFAPRFCPLKADFRRSAHSGLPGAGSVLSSKLAKSWKNKHLTSQDILKHQENSAMSRTVKYAERAVTIAAQGAWTVFEKLNSISPNPS